MLLFSKNVFTSADIVQTINVQMKNTMDKPFSCVFGRFVSQN